MLRGLPALLILVIRGKSPIRHTTCILGIGAGKLMRWRLRFITPSVLIEGDENRLPGIEEGD